MYGLDIRTDMEEIRKTLGMCPQHNVLFDKYVNVVLLLHYICSSCSSSVLVLLGKKQNHRNID